MLSWGPFFFFPHFIFAHGSAVTYPIVDLGWAAHYKLWFLP